MLFGTLVDTSDADAERGGARSAAPGAMPLAPLLALHGVLRWPLHALLAWCGAWALHMTLVALQVPAPIAALLAAAAGLAAAMRQPSRWRRGIVGGGFPLSWALVALSSGTLPPLGWLAPLALLALAYPLGAWRDAPFFPTPPGALDGLERILPLPAGVRLLDAGCGAGHGLQALARAYPQARLEGVERSTVWALAARWRCRRAQVRRGDMWAGSWRDHDLVYLFQRPESLPRALAKARAQMRPGTWLASLEFDSPEVAAQASHRCPDGRTVWLYSVDALRARAAA